jgi:hypothetical protein
MLGNYRVAAQVVASRAVLNSTELGSMCVSVRACVCGHALTRVCAVFPLVEYIYNSLSLMPSNLLHRAAIPLHLLGTWPESQSENIALTELFQMLFHTSGKQFCSLKPISYKRFQMLQQTKTLLSTHTVYLCVPYGSNKISDCFP